MTNEQPKQMTPLEALGIIDQVSAAHKGTRQDHIVLQQALRVIASLVPPSDETAPVEE